MVHFQENQKKKKKFEPIKEMGKTWVNSNLTY